ncbi:MAG: hypothetical protein AB8B60_03840 [Sulfitobacter sp.]
MKPGFALSLSFEGIRLLHRAAGGWRVVGDVALDAADMAGELEVLRKTAASLEPGGVRTKLLLPNEQIKYLTVDTPDMDEEARRAAAMAALDGATPYPVADLAFDLSADGDKTHIAAVAHETLAEAEAFAVEHRFNPIFFAAIPGDQTYLGEPFFGATKGAAELLGTDRAVEPDGIAVVVIGDIETPDGPVIDQSDEAARVQVTAVTADIARDPAPEAEDATGEDAPLDEVPAPEPPKAAPLPPENPPAPPPAEIVAEVAPPDVSAVAPTPEAGKTNATATSGTGPDPDQASPDPAENDAAPTLGFASRRATDSPSVPRLGGASRGAAASGGPATPIPDPVAPAPGSVTAGQIAIEPDNEFFRAAPAEPEPEAKPGFLSRRLSKPKPSAAPVAPPPPAAAHNDAVAGSEKERMTIFGARSEQVGGKPRFLGLILTAALLVFLAGVAAWASVFLDDGLKLSRLFGDREPVVADVAPTPTLPQSLPEPKVVTASLDPSLTDEDAAVLDALRDPVQPATPDTLSDAELQAQYAATGIWPRAPQVPAEPAGLINIEDLYLTSIDPVSTSTDAVALPGVAGFETDVVLGYVSSPAAAGTQFALDENGLVIPTAAGALSPDGFTVYLGAPPLAPPATPTRFQSVPQDTAIRSALAAFRPQPRPGDLVENTERAQLDGLTRSELASYRPALRPQSLQQQAEAAEAPAPAAPEAETAVAPEVTDGAVALALANPSTIENATKFAVRASIRPDTRPRNFSRIVKRAQRNTEKQDEVRVASAGAVAPRVVQPKIPSKTSVAKQATVKNALNLRKVNLIGVYGKPSNRRALVRLGNGRYKKVVVGDRIDGGRVSAIGEGELRYTKRGRNLVLKMPR